MLDCQNDRNCESPREAEASERARRTAILGDAAAAYLSAIHYTTLIAIHPQGARAILERTMPCIVATWHGQNYFVPLIRKPAEKVKVLVSRSPDGLIFAHTLQRFGFGIIFGSGAGENRQDIIRKHSIRAFFEMRTALRTGHTIAMTADVPKTARVVGRGIITLASASRKPIIPVAAVSRRSHTLKGTWDQTTIGCLFSPITVVVGTPIYLGKLADDSALEIARREVEDALNAVNSDARQLANSRGCL